MDTDWCVPHASVHVRTVAVIWKLFGKSLRPAALQSQPQVIMSDDTNSAYNGLKLVWASLTHKLLCLWHVMRNVKKKCLACQGPSQTKQKIKKISKKKIKKQTKHQVQKVSKKKKKNKKNNNKTPTSTPPSTSGSTSVTNRTYGLSMYEFFVILVEERDKDLFYTYLRAFRDNLKRHQLQTLSDYFEEYYFKPDRIKQWASWYRLKMFDCEWLLVTNMHTES